MIVILLQMFLDIIRPLNTKLGQNGTEPLSVTRYDRTVGNIAANGYTTNYTFSIARSGYHPLGIVAYMNSGSVRPLPFTYIIDGSNMTCRYDFVNNSGSAITNFGFSVWILYVSNQFNSWS